MQNTNNIQDLTLYHYQSCPYSAVARQAIEQTGLSIEQRDVLLQPHHRAELTNEGGKPQVPCLRIERKNGDTHWLYESQDIIQFVRQYAKKPNQTA